MASKYSINHDTRRGQASPPIEYVELKGHSAAVLCLDHSNSAIQKFQTANAHQQHGYDSTLLSGSEDGTCRLWDLRAGLRASLCIRCYNGTDVSTNDCRDVLSVSFGPPWQQQEQPQPPQQPASHTDAVSPFARDYSVYAAVGSNIYGYDLRYAVSPIITIPSTDFSFFDCTDEINQIMLSASAAPSCPSIIKSKVKQRGTSQNKQATSNLHTTRASYLLATADDSGTVRVTSSIEKDTKIHDRLKRRRVYIHEDTALVTSIVYRPIQRSISKNKKQLSVVLASGGTDCCIRLWDVSACAGFPNETTTENQSSQSPFSLISIPQISSSDTNQVCNPPMVHCLQWSPSGQLLVAGLGDGSVAMMHHPTSNASLILSHRIDDAHSGTVASCLFPAWTNKLCCSSAITANDRLLCTTGNDGQVAFWDIGESICGGRANIPTNLFPVQLDMDDCPQDVGNTKASAVHTSKRNKHIENSTGSIDLPQTLFAFQHHVKPNWMIHSGSNDTSFPYSLFVADVSNTITAYTIPIR